MLKEIARVTEIGTDHVWLEAQRKTVCGSCQAVEGCGVSLLDRLYSPAATRIRVSSKSGFGQAGIAEGDIVELGLDEMALLRSSALVYLVPVVLMMAFAMMAGQAGQSEVIVLACAMAGLAVGFYAVSCLSRKLVTNADYHAVLIRKIEN